MSVVVFNMLDMFPLGKYTNLNLIGGHMQIEIHLMRGETVTSFEFPEPGKLLVKIQMGLPEQTFRDHCKDAIHPDTMNKVISLWCNPDHPREFEEVGRHLIIRDSA